MAEHGQASPEGSHGFPSGLTVVSRDKWQDQFYSDAKAKEADITDDTLDFFNVPADRRYLAYGGAIVQHQGRHDAARVDRAVGVGMLLAFAKIDCDERNCESLFGKEYAHAPQIG